MAATAIEGLLRVVDAGPKRERAPSCNGHVKGLGPCFHVVAVIHLLSWNECLHALLPYNGHVCNAGTESPPDPASVRR